uniref:Uncharacterized protein n=2 Tax=Lotharella globosa TaxID=91324 RepID=A0A7S4DFQ8_9EUKA|mmetsp:Transcript_26407/g.51635  ORF Transcript_26407/g.51635 Transcript_26407/m.51635 type:complete len:140 (+) Transcript_26407:568-987(+)
MFLRSSSSNKTCIATSSTLTDAKSNAIAESSFDNNAGSSSNEEMLQPFPRENMEASERESRVVHPVFLSKQPPETEANLPIPSGKQQQQQGDDDTRHDAVETLFLRPAGALETNRQRQLHEEDYHKRGDDGTVAFFLAS